MVLKIDQNDVVDTIGRIIQLSAWDNEAAVAVKSVHPHSILILYIWGLAAPWFQLLCGILWAP